jgi:hypothetical protein
MYIQCICYNGSLVSWTVVSLTTAKFKPLIIYISSFALSYTTNILILIILYDFCLLPAQFCYIIVYIRKVESRVQIVDLCAPWIISDGGENLVFRRCSFKKQVSAANSQTVQRQQHQHKIGYINQAQQKLPATVKANTNNFQKALHILNLATMAMHYFTVIVFKINVYFLYVVFGSVCKKHTSEN